MPLLGRGDSGFESLHPDTMEKLSGYERFSIEEATIVDINVGEYKSAEEAAHLETLDLTNKVEELQAREAVFKSFIESRLYKVFEDSLMENEYTSEEIDEIRGRLNDFSIEEKKRMLSLAYENRDRILRTYKQRIDKKEVGAGTLVDALEKLATHFGAEVAFHCSNENILPKTEKKFTGQTVENINSWEIVGTEMDHRYNDMKMAYFSFDYEHLYRVKNPKYIYLVRVKTQKGSGYHTDIGNNWGTAQNLDIIDKIDIAAIDQFMDKIIGEYKNIETKKDAA